MPKPAKRKIREPGGILLIGCGAPEACLRVAIEAQYDKSDSLTVLILPHQSAEAVRADEIWYWQRLGFKGFLALIRRISWRRFDKIINPFPPHYGFLRFFIWPRPVWINEKPSREN